MSRGRNGVGLMGWVLGRILLPWLAIEDEEEKSFCLAKSGLMKCFFLVSVSKSGSVIFLLPLCFLGDCVDFLFGPVKSEFLRNFILMSLLRMTMLLLNLRVRFELSMILKL